MEDLLILRPMGNGLWIEDSTSSQSQQYLNKSQCESAFMAVLEEELQAHERDLSEKIAQAFEAKATGIYSGAQVARILRSVAKDIESENRETQKPQDRV